MLVNPAEQGGAHEGGSLGATLLARHWVEHLAAEGLAVSVRHTETRSELTEAELLCETKRAAGALLHEHGPFCTFTATHAVPPALVTAVRERFPGQSIGLLWCDAHADAHLPRTSSTGRLHGMSLALCLDLQDPASARWNELRQAVQVTGPAVQAVGIGWRDVEEAEVSNLAELPLRKISVEDLKEGPEAAAQAALDALCNCDHLVLSFDIDLIDANCLPGTASPAWAGPNSIEAAIFLRTILRDLRVEIFEVTEYNPAFD